MTEAAQGPFVARKSEYAVISDTIASFASRPASGGGLQIIGVSGYGGVGKSYLLENVLREAKRSLNDSLIIRLDGSNPKLLVDFAAIIDHQLAPPTLPAPANAKYDYFSQTRRLVRALRRLREGVDRELDHHQHIAENVKKLAKVIYRLRPLLSKIPSAGPWIDTLVRGMEALGAA
jgi:hypothetical protein